MLKEYVKAKLVDLRGASYYYKDKTQEIRLGKGKAESRQTLRRLVQAGKIDKIEKQEELIKEEEIKDESREDKLVELPRLSENKKLTDTKDIPQDIDDIYKELASKIGDIEAHQKGGRFYAYVQGIDIRLKDHPIIKRCPYVFRPKKMKTNVADGESINNEGWTVLSKAWVKPDPKTGKAWFMPRRDDTPNQDYYRVGDYVWCVANKTGFERKKAKLALKSKLKPVQEADKRVEVAEKMAALSKRNPEASIAGYEDANRADIMRLKQDITENKKMSTKDALKYIDKLQSGADADINLAEMHKLADEGKLGRSLKDVSKITVNSE
jgi:hypothetical protein